MNYSEAIAYIHGTYKFGRKLGLENITRLLELMDNPQEKLKVVHVAGTNGKGSTSAFIANILLEAGFNVGLFSSPFLQIFNERIRLNRQNIPNEKLADITGFVKERIDLMLEDGADHPTEFEIVTAIAFEYFKRENADYVVLEVGMGGRLDSTNVVKNPLCAVITPIAMDHMDYLGETLADIAAEKAGIIKPNLNVICHEQEPEAMRVVEDICEKRQAKLKVVTMGKITITKETLNETRFEYRKKTYSIPLLGRHQTRNAVLALNAVQALDLPEVTEGILKRGLSVTKWPGRMEILSKKPLIFIDGAHNFHGAMSLKETMEHLLKGKHVIGVIGMLKDKEIDRVLEIVMPLFDEIIVTEPRSDRRMTYTELTKKVKVFNKKAKGFERILDALIEAKSMAVEDDVIIVFGSLYMVGEVRSILSE
jgi:dihydrofolate synthase/folylpolyglutamate synthase